VTSENERWEEAQRLFERALEVPAERRTEFLHNECSDPELRDEVDRLLRAHGELAGGSGNDFLTALDAAAAGRLLETPAGDDSEAEDDFDELEPGTMLGRYRVIRRLGRGGMAEVYLAHDPRLDRPVAIKLLPRHSSVDPSARRQLEDEARAASALDHPSIVTIYEIGEARGGLVFIVMAYYEGETLRHKLARGPLPVHEAWEIARTIAEALAAAHGNGIVHRDIKPANVLITAEGRVKILDFGIAKLAGRDLTARRAALGTVAYMSPEQTRGAASEPTTDIWSLGVTLYEMLTGKRPFPAAHEQARIYAIRTDEPEPIRHLRAEVPAELAAVVERCLSKRTDQRYPHGAALLAALQASAPTTSRSRRRRNAIARYGSVAAILVLLLAGAWAYLQHREAPLTLEASEQQTPATGTRRLAVLPLDNFSPDPEDAYFADGLTEELISRLSRVAGLAVIARTSVMRYRESDADISAIGEDLGVEAVLEGSVRKSGERVRISIKLVDSSSKEQLWSEDYEAGLTDVLTVQRNIAERVAEALRVELRDQHPLDTKQDVDPDAYTEYLKGRYFLSKLDVSSFSKATDHFRNALDIDPLFPRAWSGLAEAYNQLTSTEMLSSSEASPRARAAAERSLALDPDLAEGHAALAMVLSMYYWKSAEAERHFLRAIELDPSSSAAHRNYSAHLRNMGRLDEALAEARKAQEMDPLSVFPRHEEAVIFFLTGDQDAAVDRSESLLAVNPTSPLTLLILAKAKAAKGEFREALDALDEGDPERIRAAHQATRGYIYATTGRPGNARQILRQLELQPGSRPVSGFHIALVHVGLGEHERALDLLEQAADERTWLIRLLGVEPTFDPLRNEPRFQALMRRVGLSG
jgi:serine/threonine protein kinase/Tfp pilus assembly protein PilF